MDTQRHILHADFDAFYISVERALNPHLRERPAVVGNRADKRGVVAAVSAEAREFGIHPSMTIARALTLCPRLHIVDGDYEMYHRASAAVGEYLQRFSPYFEPASVDEAYLDLTGTQRLFGGAVDIGARISREIRNRFSLDLRIGVAANKLVSKIASRSIKPTELCDVTPGSESAFLAPLEVRRLPVVGPRMTKRLLDFNIETIGDLAEAARAFLTSAFGRRGFILYAQARGIDDTPVQRIHKPKTITQEETFTHDSNSRELISAAIFRAIEKAALCLRRHELLAGSVSVSVRYIDGKQTTGSQRLPQATDLDEEIYAGATAGLKRALTRRLAVRCLGIRLSHLCPASPQLSLIEDGRRYDRKRALVSAIDRIRDTFGVGSIVSGRVLNQSPAVLDTTRAA